MYWQQIVVFLYYTSVLSVYIRKQKEYVSLEFSKIENEENEKFFQKILRLDIKLKKLFDHDSFKIDY